MLKRFLNLITLGAISFNLWASDVSQQQLQQLMQSQNKPILIDVRSEKEYRQGHIPGAVNIPHNNIGSQINTLGIAKDQIIVLYCRSGYRASKAGKTLKQLGFTQLSHLEGDYLAWQANKLPIQSDK